MICYDFLWHSRPNRALTNAADTPSMTSIWKAVSDHDVGGHE